jgi:diguanylate cyclase (GGDEF)-like protein
LGLALLAWADRRARWLRPLAAACTLHVVAIYLMPLWRQQGLWLPHAFSAAMLPLMLYLIHLGLQALVLPRQDRSNWLYASVCAGMLLLFALAACDSLWCIEASEIIASLMLAGTIRMVWGACTSALYVACRFTSVLLLLLMLSFLLRMPLEALSPAPPVFLYLREATMLFVTSLAFSFLVLYAAETRRKLHVESRIDIVTGLPNRRAMEEDAAQQLAHAASDRTSCALLILDLDNFKRLNDTWGHAVGDQALRATGKLLLRLARQVERCHVARMGGEEFALLLPDATIPAAQSLAERLRDEIAALRIPVHEGEVRFTASVGVSALRPGETDWLEMLRRADMAMYEAKHAGRNRVMLCAETMDRLVARETPRRPFRIYG